MRLLVTAGPTREFIDAVRFISNRSSGRMGYAVARAGVAAGHAVRLISGPVCLAEPEGVERVHRVVTAADMLEAVRAQLTWAEALVMAAAVADWAPAQASAGKLKKTAMPGALPLRRTEDILTALRPLKEGRIFVGFAAETENLLPEARRKLAAKGLDLIVANDVTQADAGFEAETNRVVLVGADGLEEALPLMSKEALGARLVDWIAGRVSPRNESTR